MAENKNMDAHSSANVYWRDPATHPPPRGVKLLVLTSGGVACFGDWMDDSNFVAWSPMPKKTRPPAEPAAEACVAFATALLRDWPDEMGVEGYDLIHIAVRAGLLVETTVRRPCGDQCRCACAYEPNEWPSGVTCYRVNPQFKRSA